MLWVSNVNNDQLDALSHADSTKGLPISGDQPPSSFDSSSGNIPLPGSVDSGISTAAGAAELHPSSTPVAPTDKEREKLLYPGRVLLTTYPDQHGISPFSITWGASSASLRGPVICSRFPGSIKVRNALGAHSGSYSIYRALSIAMGSLSPTHIPDYSMTQPPVDIPPNPSWFDKNKIVSLDPWGHLVPSVFAREIREKDQGGLGLDIRPSISVTKAHIKLKEIDESVNRGEIIVDGKIVLQSDPLRMPDGSLVPGLEAGVSLSRSHYIIRRNNHIPLGRSECQQSCSRSDLVPPRRCRAFRNVCVISRLPSLFGY